MEHEQYMDGELLCEEYDDKYGIKRSNDDYEKKYLIDYENDVIVVS